MPDKPSIDGLEDKWAQVWAEQGTYAFDRAGARAAARAGLLHRHPAADGVRLACTSATCSPTRTPTAWPATSGCAGFEVFYPIGWDDNGLPTERRVQNYYGVRGDAIAALRRGLRSRRIEGGDGKSHQGRRPAADQPAELHRAVRRAHRRGREGLRVALPPARASASTGTSPTAPSTTTRAPRPSRRSCATSRRGEAYQAEAPGPVGRHLPDRRRPGRARGPRLPRRLPPGRLPRRRRRARSTSRPPAPSCIPPCVALIAHPDDERYQPLFGTTVTSPLFGVEVPVLAHPPAEPDKGAGIAMCCTFGDLTDVHVVARAAAADPRRSSAATAASRPRRPSGSPPSRASALLRRARRQDDVQRPRGRRGRAARVRRPRRRADSRPSARPTSTRRATSRSRSSPRASGTSATAAATRDAATPSSSAAASEIDFHPAFMRLALRELGRRPQRRLADLAASASSACRSRSGTPLDADGEPDYDQPDRARPRPQLPVDPAADAARRLRRGPARRSPAASSATPTSWTPGPPPR